MINSQKWKKTCLKGACRENKFFDASSDKKKSKIKTYSDKSIVWLESIAQEKGIIIQHALNGGEFTISRNSSIIDFGASLYRVDGYCKETNTAYEFHGDYWHGNPQLYDSNTINDRTNCTFGELHQKTLEREKFIRDSGYNLVVIWESEFDQLS